MGKIRSKVVLDTNIEVSAIVFEGKPAKVLTLALEKTIVVYISKFLLSELQEILIKKFDFTQLRVKQIEKKLTKIFKIVYPKKQVFISRDSDDNKVLEAGVEGKCQFIITGDKDLLDVKSYKDIKIMTADQFLELFDNY